MSLQSNTLYYGDCLEWLPRFPADSVDLIYLDPPFNSNTSYNLLFGNGSPKRNGGRSAQVRAFDDTWRWDDAAARRVDRLARAAAHPAHKAVVRLRTMIGEGGMLAYLSYMAERLATMRHVLKPTGSIYLHCDPTASHGLKLVMDMIFRTAKTSERRSSGSGPRLIAIPSRDAHSMAAYMMWCCCSTPRAHHGRGTRYTRPMIGSTSGGSIVISRSIPTVDTRWTISRDRGGRQREIPVMK